MEDFLCFVMVCCVGFLWSMAVGFPFPFCVHFFSCARLGLMMGLVVGLVVGLEAIFQIFVGIVE